jgi:hypothetical protein
LVHSARAIEGAGEKVEDEKEAILKEPVVIKLLCVMLLNQKSCGIRSKK